MDKKSVLVVGSGGRCHAIVDALARSPQVGKIFCAPGNAGISALAECVGIGVTDIMALADFAESHEIDLTVVGPEASLCAGIADEFNSRGLPVFGPDKAAARIESSKEFAKEIMARAGVPTASYRPFTDFKEALEYVRGRQLPTVIKYDGLAAGKGVVVALTYEEAEDALRDMLLDGSFGEGKVIIEDFLEGSEFSFMCFVNGRKVYPLAVAQDHKRAFDGDKGPNTGGMGAYSPVPFITPDIEQTALDTILRPVANELVENGTPFLGVLYGGLILTESGPKVIEFNARFGDPETEVVLPRLESDLYEFITAVMEGRDFTPVWSPDGCLGIVLAAKGYPGKYAKGLPLDISEKGIIYHMGTRKSTDGIVSDGGRVLMVVGKAENLTRARQQSLAAVEKIATDDFFYRKDIGKGIILDGKKLAAEIKASIASRINLLLAEGCRRPGLALVLVGDDKGSASYVAGKAKDAAEVGIEAFEVHLDKNVGQEELLDVIHRLNHDEAVDGIMVQLPLPSHIDEAEVIASIRPDKDVDGFHPVNVAALWSGMGKGIIPCTPKGIMKLLEANDIRIAGKRATVVGRSNIVGLPVAKMLLNHNATVTMAHSLTGKLSDVTREADILVVAAGHHHLITGDMIRPGAVVIDVGINRNPETGRLQGDTVFESCRPVASAITPVPGGIGPLTKSCLMENTLEACLNHLDPQNPTTIKSTKPI